MPKIVKQCARASDNASLSAYLMMSAKQIQRSRHQMHNADGMSETAMLSALICEHCYAELFDTAQALELG